MDRLTPVLFNDAWGSHVSIASLQGRPIPSAEPESELWMGAHEDGPAGVQRNGRPTTLDRIIGADPTGELGEACVRAHGRRLPFLLKVLAPGRALSIQVHPTAEQARELRASGVEGVYVDEGAKPEMLIAIAPFEVFVGMRDPDDIARLAGKLRVPRLSALVAAAAEAPDPAHALLASVLAVPAEEHSAFARELVAACVRVEGAADDDGHACAAVVRVAEEHADDIGLAVLLLMHHRVLEPGQYIDVPAGVLHSYVSGLGIEVLANSDNVVRAGLTDKEINVAELLRIVDSAAEGSVAAPRLEGPDGTVDVYRSSSGLFVLHRLPAADGATLPGDGGPRIAFCLRGEVRLRCGEQTLVLGDAESAFLPAGDAAVMATGHGDLWVVTP